MKKTYTKPYLATESFQLDAAIAASCSSEGKGALGYSMDTCTLDDDKGLYQPDMGYFGNACRHDVRVEGDGNDLICYHGPLGSANSMFMNS